MKHCNAHYTGLGVFRARSQILRQNCNLSVKAVPRNSTGMLSCVRDTSLKKKWFLRIFAQQNTKPGKKNETSTKNKTLLYDADRLPGRVDCTVETVACAAFAITCQSSTFQLPKTPQSTAHDSIIPLEKVKISPRK